MDGKFHPEPADISTRQIGLLILLEQWRGMLYLTNHQPHTLFCYVRQQLQMSLHHTWYPMDL